MKKNLRNITRVVIVLFVVCTLFAVPDTTFAKVVEKDTSWFNHENRKDSYKISTEAQLIGLCSLVNEEQVDKWKPERLEYFEGVTFTLTRDIKLTQDWTPIGIDDSAYFAGTFDGNGHTISNVKIVNGVVNSGFFGYLAGKVENLNIEGSNESNVKNCGGLVGTLANSGYIYNCTTDMDVNGKEKTGGIVGYNEGGTIEHSINRGDVNGTFKVGGVTGENRDGRVFECGNSGNIKSTSRGVGTFGTGGVAGRSLGAESEIKECYNYGNILSNTEATGGVVGYMGGDGAVVTNSYNIGIIKLNIKTDDKESEDSYTGGVAGIVGSKGIEVRNCYSIGTISNSDFTGGVLGSYLNALEENEKDSKTKYIKNNYFVTSTTRNGIGYLEDQKDENLDKASRGVSLSNMRNLSNSLSAQYMKDSGGYGNDGYPVLRWQEPLAEEEKTYFKEIPEEVQKELDSYMIESVDEKQYGKTIIDVLSPQNLTSDAFIVYAEAQDKLENLKEETTQND